MQNENTISRFAGPWLQRSAIAGTIVWELGFIWRSSTLIETELINKILLLAVLVVVPLGLNLAATNQKERSSRTFRLAAGAQPFGAAAVVISFLLEQGIAAALLACVWLIVSGLIAIHGLSRLLARDQRVFSEVSISAGLAYLSVGSGWLVMSRLGIQPLGFGDTIVLLTAVHFHYAGFAAPILAGLAGRVLVDRSANIQRLFALVVLGVIAGTPLVAAGITLSPAVGLAGTLIISAALILLGVLVVGWVVPKVTRRSVQALLVLSSISPFISMTLASVYAYSIVAKKLIIDIPQMALTHGMINAFGFSLCGLLAWSLLRSDSN
jgi:hypothetical protein